MAIPIINSRELKNTWRILDDKLGNYRDRGLPFKYPYVGAFSQSVAEWFIRVYSNVGDTVFEPFCVCKDSKILLNQQDSVNMQDIYMRKDAQIDLFGNYRYIDNVMSIDMDRSADGDDRDDLIKSSSIENFFVRKSDNVNILEISSRNRRRLRASENHVFLVKNGNNLEWKQLKDIKFGDMVAVYPQIINLDNNVQEDIVILDEQDIIDEMHNNTDSDYVLCELQNAGLLPLTSSHPKLHILARLLGFLMTDGYINESSGEYERSDYNGKCDKTYVHVHFTAGSRNSLLNILYDMRLLGFDVKGHIVDVREKRSGDFNWGKCADLDISSKTLYVLFRSLGMCTGKKTEQDFGVPKWIYSCSKRVKQEFLGGLVGGDGITVGYRDKKHTKEKRIIPYITGGGFVQSKIAELESSLLTYLSGISLLLKEFGIDHRTILASRDYGREDGKETLTYRIDFLDNHRNTLRFLRYIGYRYDNHKLEESCYIYEYLLSKENRIGIDSSVSRGNNFPVFKKWKEMYTLNGVIFDEVITVKKIEYSDELYDLRIQNTHNYIVNGFITHNSGRGTTIMQSLWNDRNVIANDLSSYSNVLCHSVMYVPYMRDVLVFINILEGYINSDRCNISTEYAGKGSDNDVAKLYHKRTFEKIIKLRNILNSSDVLLGLREDLLGDIGNEYKDDPKIVRTYRHEVVIFTRMVMSQLMLHSSRDMSFNGIKTRGTDNTYIKGILKYYSSLGESPYDINIFENMRHYVNHMGLDELGVKNKFGRLSRKLISCDARKLDLPDKCSDIVVTSPPYYANLNYGMANWLRIMAIGGIGDPLIGNHINTNMLEKNDNSEIYGKTYDRITDRAGGTVDNPMSYSGFTGQYLHELYRVLKDDAVAIIVVGDYGNKRKVEAWRLVTDRAELFGFKPVMIIMDELNKQTKSSTQFQMKHDGGKNDYDVMVVLFKGNYKQKNNPEDIDFRWGAKFVDGSQLDIESAWGM